VNWSWMEEAACRGMNPNLFHQFSGASYREERRVCANCPVRFPCKEYAIEAREEQGLWGRLTPDERVSERRRRQRKRLEQAS